MKRILLIAYLFPPIANSGSQRPLKLAKYLPDFGWTPEVLTVSDAPGEVMDPRLLDEVRPDTVIHRVPFASAQWADRLATVVGPLKPRVAGAIEWRIRARYRFPDACAAWGPAALRHALRLSRQRPFDAVVATGYPWTSFTVARAVGSKTGTPWIVDYRDAWGGDEVFADREAESVRRRQQQLERAILQEATRVVAVTEPLAEHLGRIGGHGCAPIDVITNGYDRQDIDEAEPYPAPSPGVLRIAYTGVWRPTYNPSALYDALARLLGLDPQLAGKVEVVMAGFAPGEAERRGLSHCVRELGPVPHHRALGIMQSAHLLFLPVAPGLHREVQIPGKLFEYLATGRPIIALADEGGAAGRLLRRTGGAVVLPPDDIAGLARILGECAGDQHVTIPAHDAAVVRSFERRALTARFAASLDETQ